MFIVASVGLTLMPGPDILFVVTQSLSQGKWSAIIFATGLCTGLIVHTTCASLGVSALLYSSAIGFEIVKYAGAAYLIYLGVQAILERKKENIALQGGSAEINMKKLYLRGIFMNILNPKVALFFLAFLPQFVRKDSPSAAWDMVILGVIFMVQAWIVFSVVAFIAERIAQKFIKNASAQKYIPWAKALLYFSVGIRIAFSQR